MFLQLFALCSLPSGMHWSSGPLIENHLVKLRPFNIAGTNAMTLFDWMMVV